jgi:hypothetical protein
MTTPFQIAFGMVATLCRPPPPRLSALPFPLARGGVTPVIEGSCEEGMMTTPQVPPPVAAAAAASIWNSEEDKNEREVVGISDADADAQRSGGDVELDDADRESDGVPVGRADAQEDAKRTGAGPDAV